MAGHVSGDDESRAEILEREIAEVLQSKGSVIPELAKRDRERTREIELALAPNSTIDLLSVIQKYDLAASWNCGRDDSARLLRKWWLQIDREERSRIDEKVREELRNWKLDNDPRDAAIFNKFEADLQTALRALLPSGQELRNVLIAPPQERKKVFLEATAELKRWLSAAFRIPKTKENPEELRHRDWADQWINGSTYHEIQQRELNNGSHIELDSIKKGVWRSIDPIRWTLRVWFYTHKEDAPLAWSDFARKLRFWGAAISGWHWLPDGNLLAV